MSKEIMPDVIQPAPHHKFSAGVCHDLFDLRQLRRGIAVDATVLATRLLRFQWAFQSPGNCICHELSALGTHLTLSKSFREQERVLLHPAMFSGAVDLNKLGDKSDILLLLFQ